MLVVFYCSVSMIVYQPWYFGCLRWTDDKHGCVYVHCRAREAELEKQFQTDLATAEADYLQKMQDMLSEFSRAQQILKDKIIKQQNMYVNMS